MSTPATTSRLDDSVLPFLHQGVVAKPLYGWGWSHDAPSPGNAAPADVPALFHFRIAEFFDWNGERRGGIGRIEQPGHIYDDQWLLFYTRHVGNIDFSKKISHYNFHIGAHRPSLHPPAKDPQMAERWPLPDFADCPVIVGYGQIAATEKALASFEKAQSRQ